MSNIPKEIPEIFLCPITQEIMTDPVLACDGHSYQRQSITEWLRRGKRKSPVTGLILSTTFLYDNTYARDFILNFINKTPAVAEYIQSSVKPDLDSCIRKKEEFIFIREFERNSFAVIESNKVEIANLDLIIKTKKEEISKMKEANLLLQKNIELHKENSKLKLKCSIKKFKK